MNLREHQVNEALWVDDWGVLLHLIDSHLIVRIEKIQTEFCQHFKKVFFKINSIVKLFVHYLSIISTSTRPQKSVALNHKPLILTIIELNPK